MNRTGWQCTQRQTCSGRTPFPYPPGGSGSNDPQSLPPHPRIPRIPRTPRIQQTSQRQVLIWLWLIPMFLASLASTSYAAEFDYRTYGAAEARKVSREPKRWVTTDHSKHAALNQQFSSPEEVTKACLGCHNEAALQVHQTIHWTWIDPADSNQTMGKNGLTLNNFCIAIHSNEPRCTSCHAGYGWKDASFDFSSQEKVDCLVCHDTTGTYKKFPTMAGYPVSAATPFGKETFLPPDYRTIAANVGRPSRTNCGTCHFYGGGGDGVKHGDLDSSMLKPSRDLDVHMNAEGANFSCQRCHSTEAHFIAGRTYKKPAYTNRASLIEDDLVKRISCESCHTDKPHKTGHKANDHTDRVACQTCHIPAYARVLPTKLEWDWSEAGKLKDGKPYKIQGDYGRPSYDSQKGVFVWGTNVEPEYHWYNGRMDYVLATDTIDPTQVVRLNRVLGERADPDARIAPFRVHRGKQPYDSVNNTMAIPHLFGKDDTAYWTNFNWGKALTTGMQAAGIPYSGEYGFVSTEYHYPITHMVAPKAKALRCSACHSREGRLASLAGFYMPGRDRDDTLDTVGWLTALAALAGVTGHGLLRMVSRRKHEQEEHHDR